MQPAKGDKKIANSIIQLRGHRVIFDFLLAQLYEVETRVLKQQVRRNIDRFPEDFMFELNTSEIEFIIKQHLIPNKGVLGGSRPMAFTEQGVAMLSSVLRSKKAVAVNIAIMRTFVHLRRILQDNRDLEMKIQRLERKYDEQFHLVFDTIKKLVKRKSVSRNPIGYRSQNKK